MLLINRVFDAFDVDEDGVVDSVELATGLTLLCGASESDRVDAAFALYDADNGMCNHISVHRQHDGYLKLTPISCILNRWIY